MGDTTVLARKMFSSSCRSQKRSCLSSLIRRTRPNIVIRTLLTMLHTHITLLETRYFSHFSPPPPFWIARDSRIGDWVLNSDWSLPYNFNIAERAATLFDTFALCSRKCLIEIKTFFHQQILNKGHQTCILHVLIIYMKKKLDFDWLRAVQFKCNTNYTSKFSIMDG